MRPDSQRNYPSTIVDLVEMVFAMTVPDQSYPSRIEDGIHLFVSAIHASKSQLFEKVTFRDMYIYSRPRKREVTKSDHEKKSMKKSEKNSV